MSNRHLVWLLVLGAVAAAHAARADIVTWTVTGHVTLFTGSTTALPYDIPVGSQYVLTLRLDDDMPAPLNTEVSSYYYGGFIDAHLTFTNGSVPMTFMPDGTSTSGGLGVTNDSYSLRPTGIVVTDAIDAGFSANNVNGYNRHFSFAGSVTQASPPNALTSLQFPDATTVASFFAIAESKSFSFNTDIDGRYYAAVSGTIDSVEVSVPAVPLPAAAGLFAVGLLGLGRFRRVVTPAADAGVSSS